MTLQLQDDEMATVEEMLAFVDSFEWSSDFFQESEALNVDADFLLEDDAKSKTQRPEVSVAALNSPPKRKRIRKGWSSSTGLQRRKKAELAYLRAHVQELETYVEQLKRRGSSQVSALHKHPPTLDWRQVALDEFIERKKSEEANRLLKTIVDNQVLVGQTLHNLLQQH